MTSPTSIAERATSCATAGLPSRATPLVSTNRSDRYDTTSKNRENCLTLVAGVSARCTAGPASRGTRPICSVAICLAGLAFFFSAERASAAEPVPFEAAAQRLTENVCTIRASVSEKATTPEGERIAKRSNEVRVYSAICLPNGLLVCPLDAARATSLRVTFPGGGQDDAALKAFDEHSGLALLRLKEARKPGLAPAKGLPAVGQWVLGGAGWGAEAPVVSVGLVSGTERSYVGSTYPPLLQADVRAAVTAAGGAIVDAQGDLLGIVVHDGKGQDGKTLGGGWTYAVPASHVERLVRAYEESRGKNEAATDDSVIVLQKRRPTVGMVLEGKSDLVVVADVEQDGPADRAGAKKGDVVVAADGVQIRTVYQAVRPTLFKQPGDEMTFRLLRGTEALDVTVVLGGGVPLEPDQSVRFLERSAPKVVVKRDDLARYFEEATEKAAENGGPADLETVEDADEAAATALMEKALDRYRKVIELQREEIELRKEENELLARELERLSKRLDELKEGAGTKSEASPAGEGAETKPSDESDSSRSDDE